MRRSPGGNLDRRPDGSGTLCIRRGGSGQEETLYLGPPTVRALEAIRPRRPDPRDRVFQLSRRQVSRRIGDAARAAGLAGHFTSDSPRFGMAEDLAAMPQQVAIYYTLSRMQ